MRGKVRNQYRRQSLSPTVPDIAEDWLDACDVCADAWNNMTQPNPRATAGATLPDTAQDRSG
eukprot:6398889-Alexandrium_andersonii.AAC.1